MGMFDDLRCELPLPDGWEGTGLQTKDLGCTMSLVTITKAGRLVGQNREWWWEAHKPERDLDFHGDLLFYGHEGSSPQATDWLWHEYIARFSEGQLVGIRVASASDGSGEADKTRSGLAEGDSAVPKGGAHA